MEHEHNRKAGVPVRSDRGVVAVAVLDGFYGCGSGAGWSNRALIEILADVLPAGIDLVVLPVRVEAVSGGWQQEWRRAVEEALGRSVRRVEVCALDGNRGGPGRFGEPVLTGVVERALARLRGEYRRGLVVLCDVGFSGAAARSTADPAWRTVIVPRTSALLIQPELAERVAWERESLRRAAGRGAWIAAISGYMRSHLTEQLGVPASAVVDLRNGVSGVDAELRVAGVADLPPAAWDGFWLAMGRAVPEKGFEDLVDALCLLRDRGVRAPHVVLAAVGESVDLSPYQRRLAERVAHEQLDISLLTRFSPQVRGLLARRRSSRPVRVAWRSLLSRAGRGTSPSSTIRPIWRGPCGARRWWTPTHASGCAGMVGRSSADSTTGSRYGPCCASSLPGSPRPVGRASG